MLVRIAQTIHWADFIQRSGVIAFPDKPAHFGITSLARRPMTDDLDQRDFCPACGAQVQVLPTLHLDPRSVHITPFPGLIRLPMRLLIFALKALPILAAGPDLTGNPQKVISIADLGAPELGVRFSGVAGSMPEALAVAADLISRGKLHIPVEKSYTLAEAAVAHIDSQAGHTRGRRVIVA